MDHKKKIQLPKGYKWVSLCIKGYDVHCGELSERDFLVFREDLEVFMEIVAYVFGLLLIECPVKDRAYFIASPAFDKKAYRAFVDTRRFYGLELETMIF